MGVAALAFFSYTGGDVRLLVVMYAINVFLTFSISQLGMCRHWWEVRHTDKLLAAQAVCEWSRFVVHGDHSHYL
jgi:hypothetical protein